MPDRFIGHLSEIRRRAREHVLEGAVTSGYHADRAKVLTMLNEALATEIVCVLRYKQHSYVARGIQAGPTAQEFAEHAAEEQEHADRIARRITQLGGEPDLNPAGLLQRSASEYIEGRTLIQMIEDNLIAERIAIDTYHEAIQFVQEKDPTTRRLLEDILAKEEEHATELADLLATLDPTKPAAPANSEPPLAEGGRQSSESGARKDAIRGGESRKEQDATQKVQDKGGRKLEGGQGGSEQSMGKDEG